MMRQHVLAARFASRTNISLSTTTHFTRSIFNGVVGLNSRGDIEFRKPTSFLLDFVPRDGEHNREDSTLPRNGMLATALTLVERIDDVIKYYSDSLPNLPPLDSFHILLTAKGSPPQPKHNDSPLGNKYFTLLIPLYDPGNAGTVFYSEEEQVRKWTKERIIRHCCRL
jgi:hypothetical protein